MNLKNLISWLEELWISAPIIIISSFRIHDTCRFIGISLLQKYTLSLFSNRKWLYYMDLNSPVSILVRFVSIDLPTELFSDEIYV